MSNLRAEFFFHDGVDHVRLAILGQGCTVIRRVRHDDKRRFHREWRSYVKTKRRTARKAAP